MKIVIAHLYYDLLNLYGENGNVKALIKYLENQGIEVEVKRKTVADILEFNSYDFIYIGAGTENNQLIALEHLINYKEQLKEYIDNNGFVLATGNSLELFGKYIIDNQAKKHKCLNIFPYHSEYLINRIICESIVESKDLQMPIIGFQNRGSVLKRNHEYWFNTIKNFKPSNNLDKQEGININSFYGSYLLGPILVRNPHLLKDIGNKLIFTKDNKFNIIDVDFDLELSSYNIDRKRYEEK